MQKAAGGGHAWFASMHGRWMDEKRFQFAVGVVLQHEGGYSDDPNDLGGSTNFGITQRFADNNDLNINVKDLTRDDAIAIYRKLFWNKYGYNNLSEIHIATKIFDAAVNCGPARAAQFLQVACNDLSTVHIVVDCAVGPKTFAAANALSQSILIRELRDIMRQYYMNLVEERPENKEFIAGWLARAGW